MYFPLPQVHRAALLVSHLNSSRGAVLRLSPMSRFMAVVIRFN